MAEPITSTAAAETAPDTVIPPAAENTVSDHKPTAVEPAAPAADTDAAPVAASVELPKEEQVGDNEVKIEAQPVAAGNLGYKAPGLIKQFRFVTKYFWFGDAALDENTLSAYLKSEKPEVGHPNAAYASQTGKGLLLFAKREDDQGTPAGILNLADATDLTKEGTNDFSFKLHGHKHTFQANSGAERDSWIVAVQRAIDESTPRKEGIVGSEGYKSKLDKFGKPAAGAAGAAAGAGAVKAAVTPHKNPDKVHDGTTQPETGTSSTAEATPKVEKSRSRSRKRASIFGKVLGKKEEAEEHKEAKKEEKTIEKAEKAEEKKEIKEENKIEKEEKIAEKEEKKAEKEHDKEAKKASEAAVATSTATASASAASTATPETPKTSQEPAATTTEPTSAKSKRGSIFGSLGMFGKKDKEATPAKKDEGVSPVKETEPVAEKPPQLDPVDTAVPSDTTKAVAPSSESMDKPVASPSPKADKTESKGGLRGLFKTREPEVKDSKDAKTETSVAKPVEPAAETSTAVTDSPADATTTSSPTSAGLKDRRRSSFFGTITGRKDRKSVEPKDRKPDATSEGELTDGDGKKSNKLQGLFRKASKSVKPQSGPVKDASAPPAPPKETETKATEAAPVASEATATTADAEKPATTTTTETPEAATEKTTEITEPSTGTAAASSTTAPVTASA